MGCVETEKFEAGLRGLAKEKLGFPVQFVGYTTAG
jgi:hypothetical protein